MNVAARNLLLLTLGATLAGQSALAHEAVPVVAAPVVAEAAPAAPVIPATPIVSAVSVSSGYYKAADCIPEADPKLLNECICKADIMKGQISGLPTNVAEVINTQLSQVPEQLASESCPGSQTAAPVGPVGVNEVSAKYEVVYQSPATLTVLVTYSTFGAGAAHPTAGSEGYTFSLASGKTIIPTDMLTVEERAKANEFVQQELTRKYGELLLEEAKARTEPYLSDAGCESCTIYYTAEGWNVRFQLYSVAPYSAGEPTITIPANLIPDPETLMAKKK